MYDVNRLSSTPQFDSSHVSKIEKSNIHCHVRDAVPALSYIIEKFKRRDFFKFTAYNNLSITIYNKPFGRFYFLNIHGINYL